MTHYSYQLAFLSQHALGQCHPGGDPALETSAEGLCPRPRTTSMSWPLAGPPPGGLLMPEAGSQNAFQLHKSICPRFSELFKVTREVVILHGLLIHSAIIWVFPVRPTWAPAASETDPPWRRQETDWQTGLRVRRAKEDLGAEGGRHHSAKESIGERPGRGLGRGEAKLEESVGQGQRGEGALQADGPPGAVCPGGLGRHDHKTLWLPGQQQGQSRDWKSVQPAGSCFLFSLGHHPERWVPKSQDTAVPVEQPGCVPRSVRPADHGGSSAPPEAHSCCSLLPCPLSPPYTAPSVATHPCPRAPWACTPFPSPQLSWWSCVFSGESVSAQGIPIFHGWEPGRAGQGVAGGCVAGAVAVGFNTRTLCAEHEHGHSPRNPASLAVPRMLGSGL